jgi:murein DD-endopeptidase MepM/ murein hydrolase activator NlpD
MRKTSLATIVLIISALLAQSTGFVFAQDSTSDEISKLNIEIDQKQKSIDQLNRQIDSYREKIQKNQSAELSLINDLSLLENRIAKTKLDIESVYAQIDLVNVQMHIIEQEMQELEDTLEKDKELITSVLQEIQVQDEELTLKLFFGTDSFSDFLDDLQQLESVSSDLNKAVDTARSSKERLTSKRDNESQKKDQLLSLEDSLRSQQVKLSSNVGAKRSLINQTQQSETEYQKLLLEVKQEQVFVNQQIGILQNQIEGKLDEHDIMGDSSVLSWPVDPTVRGISATFHDPTYPFRHLFEHSGLDLPATTGTPITSPAPGYIAWTRQGRLYGNYVMIIHADGVATLYAHMSRIDVSPDQFVSRGQQIGAVGSTGLSTGPHLHFEVRKNGIPTNPLNYLISY